MVLGISGAVLAQAVWLICRGTIDASPSGLTAGIVGVDVFHDHFEASVRLRRAPRCRHLVFFGYGMQPDHGVSDPDLAVDHGAVLGPMQAARGEAERPDEEVMSGLDVVVDEDRDDSGLGGGAPLSRHTVKLQRRVA